MTLSQRSLIFSTVALLLLGATGCSKSDPNAPVTSGTAKSVDVADGKQISVAGVSMTFPTDWQTINMSAGEFDKALESIAKGPRGPEMVSAAKQAAQTGMVKLIVFAPKGSQPGFMNNANLIVNPGVGTATIQQALDASKQQLTAIGAEGVAGSSVKFPAGDFGRLESQLKGANGQKYVALGYIGIHNGSMFVLTFSCLPPQKTEFDAVATKVMQTFKYD